MNRFSVAATEAGMFSAFVGIASGLVALVAGGVLFVCDYKWLGFSALCYAAALIWLGLTCGTSVCARIRKPALDETPAMNEPQPDIAFTCAYWDYLRNGGEEPNPAAHGLDPILAEVLARQVHIEFENQVRARAISAAKGGKR